MIITSIVSKFSLIKGSAEQMPPRSGIITKDAKHDYRNSPGTEFPLHLPDRIRKRAGGPRVLRPGELFLALSLTLGILQNDPQITDDGVQQLWV